jgi:hypothetical protein
MCLSVWRTKQLPSNARQKPEEQIEKALADVGVSNLYRTVDDQAADVLINRAEEMLWPAGGDRRAPWRDVASRALTNERWCWPWPLPLL